MKNKLIWPAFVIFSGVVTLAQPGMTDIESTRVWGPPREGVRISIKSSKPEYAKGETVWIDLKYQNQSGSEYSLRQGLLQSCLFDIELPKRSRREVLYGKLEVYRQPKPLAPMTLLARDLLDPIQTRRMISVPLSPSYEQQQGVPISVLYDMSLTGIYKVSAKAQVWKSENSNGATIDVMSNDIEVSIAGSLAESGFKMGLKPMVKFKDR